QAYGTTFEPVGIVYNKRLLAAGDVPHTRAEFLKLIKSDPARFQGKVTTFDIEKSGSGFLFLTEDAKIDPALTWDVVRAMAGPGHARHRIGAAVDPCRRRGREHDGGIDEAVRQEPEADRDQRPARNLLRPDQAPQIPEAVAADDQALSPAELVVDGTRGRIVD